MSTEQPKYQLPAELQDRIPTPPGVCIECMHNNARFFRRTPTVLVTYCEHGLTAAFVDLQLPRPLWTAYAPLSRDEWDNMLTDAASGFMALLRGDTATAKDTSMSS